MLQTIDLKGNNYALVPTRLKAFREANPRASVETKPMVQENGTLIFEAKIVVDKKDPNSATATGHAYGKLTEAKAFEKLETNAVGRALALLGYLNNGQVATTEEMIEFEDYKEHQFNELMDEIKSATKREEFAKILAQMTPEQKQVAAPVVNERIKELKENVTTSTS